MASQTRRPGGCVAAYVALAGRRMDTTLLGPDEAIELELLAARHVPGIFTLVDQNRAFLRQWLPWVDANVSQGSTEQFVRAAIEQNAEGRGPQYAIFFESELCGLCGFHSLDTRNRIGSLGYWLAEPFCGRGVMTCAVRRVLAIGFGPLQLKRVDIACATGNARSRAIPERLGFYCEAVIPDRERLHGRYVDHVLYSLLASEFS